MQLKNSNLKIDFDGQYFTFDLDTNKRRKITSRRFPNLIGENEWNSVGTEILDMFYQIESEAFDNYYTIRGLIAEDLAEKYLTQWFKSQKGIDVELKHFAPQQFDAYDQFSSNQHFGGVVDIAIISPEKERAVIEVKGKDTSKLEKIETKRPQEEVAQGELLSYLSRVKQYYMCYVFFDELQESKMKRLAEQIKASGKKIGDVCYKKKNDVIAHFNLSINDVVVRLYKYDLNDTQTELRMKKAYNTVVQFKNTKKIHVSNFKMDEVNYLKSFGKKPLTDEELFKQYIEMSKNETFKL